MVIPILQECEAEYKHSSKMDFPYADNYLY